MGMQFKPSRARRPVQGTSAEATAALIDFNSAALSDEFASMTIGDTFGRETRPLPLPEICLPKRDRRWGGFGLHPGQINPRHRGIQVVIEMPVMIEPNQI